MPKYPTMMGPTLSKGLTGMSKKQLGSDKGLKSAQETKDIIDRLSIAEAPYKDELEDLAVLLCKEMFPIIEDQGYQINAKIVPIDDVNASLSEVDQDMQPFTSQERHRIGNATVQGAAVEAMRNFQFNDMYNDYIAAIDPNLRKEYADITKKIFQVYNDPITIPMMLQIAYAGQVSGAGSSKHRKIGGDIKENEAGKKTYIIDALGVCFPVLVHEIIKGTIDILEQHNLTGGSKEANQAIVDAVDTLENEIEDIQYGPFIYRAILKPFENSKYKQDLRLREFLLVNIYKIKDNADFSNYVRSALASYVVDEYNSASTKDKKHLQDAYNELIQPAVKAKWQADWRRWTIWADKAIQTGYDYYSNKDKR